MATATKYLRDPQIPTVSDESSGEVRDQDVVIARICSVEAALVSSVAAAMPHWSPDVFKIAADTRDRPLLLMSMLLFENLEVGY